MQEIEQLYLLSLFGWSGWRGPVLRAVCLDFPYLHDAAIGVYEKERNAAEHEAPRAYGPLDALSRG